MNFKFLSRHSLMLFALCGVSSQIYASQAPKPIYTTEHHKKIDAQLAAHVPQLPAVLRPIIAHYIPVTRIDTQATVQEFVDRAQKNGKDVSLALNSDGTLKTFNIAGFMSFGCFLTVIFFNTSASISHRCSERYSYYPTLDQFKHDDTGGPLGAFDRATKKYNGNTNLNLDHVSLVRPIDTTFKTLSGVKVPKRITPVGSTIIEITDIDRCIRTNRRRIRRELRDAESPSAATIAAAAKSKAVRKGAAASSARP